MLAEATCSSAIRTAKDIVSDVGEAAAKNSGGLLDLAQCTESHSERDCHRVLVNKLHLSLPIPFHYLEKNKKLKIPIFRVQDWFRFLLNHNLWHVTTGLQNPNPPRSEAQWETFWSLYRQENGNHQIFARADRGEIDLRRTAAILVHGDEGRGRRRQAFFVCSFHSILGKGSSVADRGSHPEASSKRQYCKLLPNFKGHSYTTRYLLCAMTKDSYTHQNDDMFHKVMDYICDDLEYMASTGVVDPHGKRFWAVMLHVVGDWPWLAKCGSFTRSFNNIQKKAAARNRQPPKGICHQCCAGMDGYPYEQIQTRRPQWLSTEHQVSPFWMDPPWLRLPHIPNEEACIWAFDLFHSFHLGAGRNLVGGVLALYSTLEAGRSVDERFELLSDRYNSWTRSEGISGLISRITKEIIQWPTTSSFPCAGWHKGAITTVMMKWIVSRFLSDDLSEEPLLQIAGEGAVAINDCITKMFASNVFLEPRESETIGELALRFLRRYASLAEKAASQNRPLFKIMPKHHVIHKIALRLLLASRAGVHTLNPICLSVQMDEDFIGRPSRLSRRVTGRRGGCPCNVLWRGIYNLHTPTMLMPVFSDLLTLEDKKKRWRAEVGSSQRTHMRSNSSN